MPAAPSPEAPAAWAWAPRLTFRARLALAYALALALALGVFGIALDRGVTRLVGGQLDDALRAIASVESTSAQGVWGSFLPGQAGGSGARVFHLSAGGSVVYRSAPEALPLPPHAPAIEEALAGREAILDVVAPESGVALRVLVAPAYNPQGGPVAAVVVVAPWGPTMAGLAQFRRLLGALGLATVALAVAGGWALAGRAMAPLRALTEAARGVQAAADLARRLPAPAAQDELGELAQVLNGMLGSLESAFARERRFTADVAHELRTPLTVMRGALEVSLRRERPVEAYREALGASLSAVLRLQSLVEGMLALARLEAGAGLSLHPMSLRTAAAEVLTARAPFAKAQGVALRLEGEGDDAWALADDLALGRVLGNLVDNALAHSGATWVRLKVLGGERPTVLVEDNGQGVPEGLEAAIFGRFVRADEARSPGGAGLGLAIAKAAAEAMGGRLWLERPADGGARFCLALQAPPTGRQPALGAFLKGQ